MILKILLKEEHVIGENILYKNDQNIFLLINDGYYEQLNLNNRIKYSSKEYDTTIIEIKEEDKIFNFSELDDNIIDYLINKR